MPKSDIPGESLLAVWRTSDRVTRYLVERLPAGLWSRPIPGATHRTIRMIAGHVHNARCMWIKMLGSGAGIRVPRSVDRRRVGQRQLLAALARSSAGMLRLLELCLATGGRLPARPAWLNLPNDVTHFVAYFVAHEAHHRGQLLLAARQLGHRLPPEIAGGLWQWKKRAKEVGPEVK